MYLLDVNVLIALGDCQHPHAEAALRFFETRAVREGWATCPLTENAFLRIFGALRYPDGPGSTQEARRVLESFRAAPGHQFWKDEISLCDHALFPTLPDSQHLTDSYLLALAAARGGKLATFDRRLDDSKVHGGREALLILDALEPSNNAP